MTKSGKTNWKREWEREWELANETSKQYCKERVEWEKRFAELVQRNKGLQQRNDALQAALVDFMFKVREMQIRMRTFSDDKAEDYLALGS
jgi:hypothetical protein